MVYLKLKGREISTVTHPIIVVVAMAFGLCVYVFRALGVFFSKFRAPIHSKTGLIYSEVGFSSYLDCLLKHTIG